MAITFVSSNVTGSITDNEHRFAASGTWLQVHPGHFVLYKVLIHSSLGTQWVQSLHLNVAFSTHCIPIKAKKVKVLVTESTSALCTVHFKISPYILNCSCHFHQVLITDDFLQRLDRDLDDLTRPSEV